VDEQGGICCPRSPILGFQSYPTMAQTPNCELQLGMSSHSTRGVPQAGMAQPPADRPCTICDGSHQPNPQLCCDCQSWNDFTHLISCEASKHAQLNGAIFSVMSGTNHAKRSRRFGHFPKTIKRPPLPRL
jgi:hypothetical protein